MGLASALVDNIGVYQQGKQTNMVLDCSYNQTYCPVGTVCNITIRNPDASILLNNNKMGDVFYPLYNSTIIPTQLGTYIARQVCCQASIGCGDYAFTFDVTPNGVKESAIQAAIPFLLFLLSVVFLVSGIMFNEQRWVIKTALYIASLLILIMASNTAIDFAMSQKSNTMLFYTFLVIIITTMIVFLGLLVYYIKAIVKSIKNAKQAKEDDLS